MQKLHSFRAGLAGALVALLSACATQSGPTYSIRAVNVPNQSQPLFRVTCDGLLSSGKACRAAAERQCAGNGVTVLEAVDRMRGNAALQDPRELTFMCGKPAPRRVEQPVAPRPAPAPEPRPEPVAQRQVLLQGNANFEVDRATLTPEARRQLDRFVDANRGAGFRRVTITGYTDSTGSLSHNQRLSEARARAVTTYLRTSGLQVGQFVSEGKGSADPVASNATADGRAQNRRVEIQVVPQ
ncbi:OmpA family protein [Burkholderia cepacia]|uniref:OmpA family protein n=1 Tax=Burkholderia cepacia TaxID=292 RepID=UPI001CF521F4|nr:OmpA family protein [Burkholderia cepacia]MCA8282723.1 OmpA family protein [Burkholderia cepacia]